MNQGRERRRATRAPSSPRVGTSKEKMAQNISTSMQGGSPIRGDNNVLIPVMATMGMNSRPMSTKIESSKVAIECTKR